MVESTPLLWMLLAACSILPVQGGIMEHQHIHWLGHASFRIEDNGKQLYIDPWKLPEKTPRADIIFITHGHYDHFSPQDIEKIRKEGTIFVATKDVAKSISGEVVTVVPGETYEVAGLKVETVAAYNLSKQFHPKQNGWVGYCITLSTGQRIYHAGDTDSTPEMRRVHCDIAFLPCGGKYTMDAKEAAAAANIFKPKAVVPMHWGDIVGSKEDVEEFRKAFKGTTIVLLAEH
jgi:L-ascorbate metabolism protein UlaG (beta-lactamase superfamily)